jgi:hypothetical protein
VTRNYPWINRAYLIRPFQGAALGVVGYIIFFAVIKATTGGTQTPSASGADTFIYFAVAFVVAYSDGTFGRMIARVTAVVLGPGDDDRHHDGEECQDNAGQNAQVPGARRPRPRRRR